MVALTKEARDKLISTVSNSKRQRLIREHTDTAEPTVPVSAVVFVAPDAHKTSVRRYHGKWVVSADNLEIVRIYSNLAMAADFASRHSYCSFDEFSVQMK